MQAFISYSVNDAILADAVYGYLKVNKIDAVKAPDDIPPGADWAASIAQTLKLRLVRFFLSAFRLGLVLVFEESRFKHGSIVRFYLKFAHTVSLRTR